MIVKNFFEQVKKLSTNVVAYIIQKPLNALLWLGVLGLLIYFIWMALYPAKAPILTGFDAYDENVQGPRVKTLWDWMDLLIVPITLALGAFFLNNLQGERQQKLADDNQKQSMMESYFDKMSDLLLKHDLRATTDPEIRSIARTRTLVLFRLLDENRKGQTLQFLYESGLIGKAPVINTTGLNLVGAKLNGATLNGSDLSGVDATSIELKKARLVNANMGGIVLENGNLRGACLKDAEMDSAILANANLDGADLTGANLFAADLSNAKCKREQLLRAKSLEYATMPNGQKFKDWIVDNKARSS